MQTAQFWIQTITVALYASSTAVDAIIQSDDSVSPERCSLATIAHRGASGYVPEHTLGAYALAITMGADFIEPDLVMTKDGQLVARHENLLDLTTDVGDHPEFAPRFKTQTVEGSELSGWFTEDFSLEELKTLRSKERFPSNRPGNARMDNVFDIPTLQEIIDLVKSMQSSRKRTIGIYPEIKYATHFKNLGLPMEQPLVDILHRNGYVNPEAPILIQSFEVSNLKELKNLTGLRLVQLCGNRARQPFDQIALGTNLTYGDMATLRGLSEVATYAYGIGPDKSYIIPRDEQDRLGEPTSFVADAHAFGLKVHPYTFRSENVFLPAEFRSVDASPDAIGDFMGEVQAFVAAGIDGLFTDQPDVPVAVRGPCVPSAATTSSLNIFVYSGLVSLSLVLIVW